MRDELLAYLLNDLEPEQRSRVEDRLENDPIWQKELERLHFYINAAEAPSAEPDELPPSDLVDSTCSFVKQATSQGETTTGKESSAAPPASLSESQDSAAGSKRWSLVDISVAAGIFLIVGTLLIPALRESRDAARRTQCQEKLRGLGTALANYAERYQGELPRIERDENVGVFVMKLADRGFLTREQLTELLVCPSTQLADDIFSGKVTIHIPTKQELADATAAKLLVIRKNMAGSFAYRIGHFDQHGKYQQVQFGGRSNAPMMADAPSFSIIGFQSANHGGHGQNVLFQDLSIRYIHSYAPASNEDHLFLNSNQQHAAGCNERDIVLGRSEISPWQATSHNSKQ